MQDLFSTLSIEVSKKCIFLISAHVQFCGGLRAFPQAARVKGSNPVSGDLILQMLSKGLIIN